MKKEEPLIMDVRIKPIVEFVAEWHGLTPRQLTFKTRKREVVEARQIAMWLAINYTRMSLAAIGANLGGKDHATCSYAKKTIDNLLETNKAFSKNFNEMYEVFKKKILPQITAYVAKNDYELGLFNAKTLKEKTDVIKREYEKRLVGIYMHSVKTLKSLEKNIGEDNVMEGFRKVKMTKELQKSIAKLRDYKMLQL